MKTIRVKPKSKTNPPKRRAVAHRTNTSACYCGHHALSSTRNRPISSPDGKLNGNRAGGEAHLVLLGNPTQTSGTFCEAFTHASEHWHTLPTSSEEAAAFQTDV